jgi:hypothetical protein
MAKLQIFLFPFVPSPYRTVPVVKTNIKQSKYIARVTKLENGQRSFEPAYRKLLTPGHDRQCLQCSKSRPSLSCVPFSTSKVEIYMSNSHMHTPRSMTVIKVTSTVIHSNTSGVVAGTYRESGTEKPGGARAVTYIDASSTLGLRVYRCRRRTESGTSRKAAYLARGRRLEQCRRGS